MPSNRSDNITRLWWPSRRHAGSRNTSTTPACLPPAWASWGRPRCVRSDDLALQFFTDAVTLARQEERAPLVAGLLNDLGNTLAAQGNAAEASRAYLESTLLARETGQTALSMTALINAAMASIDEGQVAQAKDRLELAYQQLHELPDSHDKAFGLLNLALGYDDLRPQISPERTRLAQLDPAALPGSRGIRHKAATSGLVC